MKSTPPSSPLGLSTDVPAPAGSLFAGLVVLSLGFGLAGPVSAIDRPRFPVASSATRLDTSCEAAGFDIPIAGPNGRLWIVHDDGLTEWDVSNPAVPVPRGGITLPLLARQRPALVGSTLALLSQRGSILLIDLSLPGAPRFVRGIEAVLREEPGYTGKVLGKIYRSIAADDEALVTVGWEQVSGRTTVERWDVSNPFEPIRLLTREVEGASWSTCSPYGSAACPVTTIDRGVVLQSSCWNATDRVWRSCFDLFRRDDLAPAGHAELSDRVVSAWVGLDHRGSAVIYRDTKGDLGEISFEPGGASCRITDQALLSWFSASPSGAVMVSAVEQWLGGYSVGPGCDVHTTTRLYSNPIWRGSYTVAVDPTGELAWMPDADTGVRGIALGEVPREAGNAAICDRRHRWPTAAASTSDGEWLYVATGEDAADPADTPGLLVIDRRDPAQPRPTTWLDLDLEASSIWVDGRFAYLLGFRGLTVFDVRDSSSPQWISSAPRRYPRADTIIGRLGDRLVAAGVDGLEVWTIAPDGGLLPLGTIPLGSASNGGGHLSFDESTCLLWLEKGPAHSIEAWDLSNPLSPVRSRGPIESTFGSVPTSLSAEEGVLFVGTSHDLFRLEASREGSDEVVHIWTVPSDFFLVRVRDLGDRLVADLVDRLLYFYPPTLAVFDLRGESPSLWAPRFLEDARCDTPLPDGWADLSSSSIRFFSFASEGVPAGFEMEESGRLVKLETAHLAPNDGVGWDFGDGTTGWGTARILHHYREPGTYFVTQTVYRAGGTASSVTRRVDLR